MLGRLANEVLRCLFGSSGAERKRVGDGGDGEAWWWRAHSRAYVDRNLFAEMQVSSLGASPLKRPRGGRRLRVLALHGRGSNNDITSVQCVSLELHDRVDVDALAAPLDDAPYARVFEMLSERPFRCWWKGAAAPESLEPALRGVLAFVDEHGPYDGLYGFSQGAGVVAALCAPGVCEALGATRTWAFVILAGANSLADGAARALVAAATDGEAPAERPPIDVPSLHLIGRLDAVRLLSAEAARLFRNPTVVYHGAGHELPLKLRRDAEFQAAVAAFLDGLPLA